MRVEANVSLRPRGRRAFGTRVEVKNMNSFRSVERAIGYEIERQGRALDAGEPLVDGDPGLGRRPQATYRMRAKETSDDYRYFPEPDLPPLHVEAAWIERVRASLPELPAARRDALREALGLSGYDAAVLVADPGMTGAFDATTAAGPDLPREGGRELRVGPARVAKASGLNAGGTAGSVDAGRHRGAARARSSPAASRGRSAGSCSSAPRRRHAGRRAPRGARARPDLGRPAPCSSTSTRYRGEPAAVDDYRAGKPMTGFFVGQVMKATGGAADAARVSSAVRQRLDAEDWTWDR